MAEIKSTLDLVMERTKHLQLSESERRQQKDRESGARLRGLIQKLQDQILSEEQFAAEYKRLKSDYELGDDAGLVSECISKLSINGDNGAFLTALNSAAGFDLNPIGDIIKKFQSRYQERATDTVQRMAETYAVKYQISGSAVTPNPNRDDQWRREEEALEAEFRQALREIAR